MTLLVLTGPFKATSYDLLFIKETEDLLLKEEYLVIIHVIFFYFSIKISVVGTH